VIRRADWIVDVGPGAGVNGGEILYSGPPAGLERIAASQTRRYLFPSTKLSPPPRRIPKAWLRLAGVTRNNLVNLDVEFPIGVFTSISGVSGSGKSTLVSQVLVDLVAQHLGQKIDSKEGEAEDLKIPSQTTRGKVVSGMEHIQRLVVVDQKPIGRTPRSNMATYTGLFDHVRKLFADTKLARSRKYDAGRFSFNVAKGRCETCSGEGFVSVELLFLPSVYSPCPTCRGARFNAKTLEVLYRGKSIADILSFTVDTAADFFRDDAQLVRAFQVLQEVGLGYLRLGQPATELSGGEAQRVKLATELQRPQRGNTLYVLDEPTTGLHPSDVDRLQHQLQSLVDAGNTIVVVEHDMQIVAASDWVIDIGPGAGDEGGCLVAIGPPETIAKTTSSRTAPFLASLILPSVQPAEGKRKH
jgi:excinuclease ABC subunit A